ASSIQLPLFDLIAFDVCSRSKLSMPISWATAACGTPRCSSRRFLVAAPLSDLVISRSEEHTSELQSRGHLVCRLLLEKKNIYRVSSGPAPRGGGPSCLSRRRINLRAESFETKPLPAVALCSRCRLRLPLFWPPLTYST